jgi:adenine deaminase
MVKVLERHCMVKVLERHGMASVLECGMVQGMETLDIAYVLEINGRVRKE